MWRSTVLSLPAQFVFLGLTMSLVLGVKYRNGGETVLPKNTRLGLEWQQGILTEGEGSIRLASLY
jgi:hypothetical protein